MSGGFGRKGVAAGAPTPRTMGSAMGNPRPSSPLSGPDAGLSPEARAFIAAERSRGADDGRHSDRPTMSAAESATRLAPTKPKSDRSMAVAYVLWWFGAFLAAHRFYLGAHRSAVAQLGLFWGGLLIGGLMSKHSTLWIGGFAVPPPGIMMILICMIWVLLDVFLIPGLMRRYRASQQRDDLTHVFA
ncbi:TM2 domain-containing protein [Sphingomonas sp. SUN039]|uniref:TM2 domain-containing protein n=1 Tax=Sphingomonas sp. SUN039 TaxID=2937787 RepID=UPI002164B2A2|nr:TM2 domain-containing protein [Sphingomonas sp. SUN039]UVO55411.1 TM2 domain-containing protein [Sphingomonas sp. SUN039]